MSKSNYKMNWYDYLVYAIISIALSLAIAFKWFSAMIGNRAYSELSSSKSSGLAYMVSLLEQSNWRFILVITFFFIALVFIKKALKIYNNKN